MEEKSSMEDNPKMTVDALTEQEYSEVFASFRKATKEREIMCSLIKPIIDSFNQKRLRLMSIGAGTGCFEDMLIKNYGLSLDYFYAIDPHEEHLETLTGSVAEWNVPYTIDKAYFTPKFETKETFDMIFMSHVLYHIPNAAEAVCSAKSFLKPNGKLLIFHDSVYGGYEVRRNFLSLVSMKSTPMSIQNLSIEELAHMLTQKGILYYIKEEPCHVDLGDFIEKRGSHVISFMLQAWYEKLPASIQSEVYNMVKERCTNPEPGKYLFSTPVKMLVIDV